MVTILFWTLYFLGFMILSFFLVMTLGDISPLFYAILFIITVILIKRFPKLNPEVRPTWMTVIGIPLLLVLFLILIWLVPMISLLSNSRSNNVSYHYPTPIVKSTIERFIIKTGQKIEITYEGTDLVYIGVVIKVISENTFQMRFTGKFNTNQVSTFSTDDPDIHIKVLKDVDQLTTPDNR